MEDKHLNKERGEKRPELKTDEKRKGREMEKVGPWLYFKRSGASTTLPHGQSADTAALAFCSRQADRC